MIQSFKNLSKSSIGIQHLIKSPNVKRCLFTSPLINLEKNYSQQNLYSSNSKFPSYSQQSAYFSTKPNIKPLGLPSLSPTMTHGTIAVWKKQPGDKLSPGDILCEIETDKASVGFEVQDEGVLASILVQAGAAEQPVGAPIALIADDATDYEAFKTFDPKEFLLASSPSSAPPSSAPSTASSPPSAPQRLSPAAKHIVESKSLDIRGVVGTAKHGLISKGDVLLALKQGQAPSQPKPPQTLSAPKPPTQVSPTTAPSPVSTPVSTPSPSPTPTAVPVSFSPNSSPINPHFTDIPNSNMRKVIAKRLTQSKSTVPHFYVSIECEIDKLLALRQSLKKEMEANVSVNDLVIRASALALRDVPAANAMFSAQAQEGQGGPQPNPSVDIAIAVATPKGLITPIVTNIDKRGLSDISDKVRDLATRARDNKLKPEEYQGGSFSISNLGMFGVSSFSAVINPPHGCILAVGSGVQRVLPPLPSDSKPSPRLATTVTVQLSGDRRVVSESDAAQFLQVFRNYLSNPVNMML